MSSAEQNYWTTPEGLAARAELIAQNLIWGAFNQSVQLYAAAQPEPPSLEWMTSGDPHVCDICTENEGVYDPGADIPEMPAHAGCRCFLRCAIWR